MSMCAAGFQDRAPVHCTKLQRCPTENSREPKNRKARASCKTQVIVPDLAMNKRALIRKIVAQLTSDLETYVRAARAAHAEATHEQSKAENKYETEGHGRNKKEELVHFYSTRTTPACSFFRVSRYDQSPVTSKVNSLCLPGFSASHVSNALEAHPLTAAG